MMDGRTNLWWMYTGRFIEGGWFSEDEPEIPRDVLLQAEDVGPEPFNATEDKFKKAFKDLVDSDKFRELREEDDKRPWFTEQRLKMNRQFWRELKECYHNY